ncbi:MAG: hypothetical protein IPL34_18680 [Thiofilum sp.]|nr:hypothetical protein [Thiofilum sp.]MBK8455313.1 hypothetical protein [Thiofilum sp.]
MKIKMATLALAVTLATALGMSSVQAASSTMTKSPTAKVMKKGHVTKAQS